MKLHQIQLLKESVQSQIDKSESQNDVEDLKELLDNLNNLPTDKQIYQVLFGQDFSDWYSGEFMDHVEDGDADSEKCVLATIQRMFHV